MISLGNFYFSTLNTKDNKYEAHLKDSYKFFYAAASEDSKNIYAINGLGMICAEKGILQVSKDIFTRVSTVVRNILFIRPLSLSNMEER